MSNAATKDPAITDERALATLDPAVRRRAEHVFADGRPYGMCARCIMNTSDSEITFDEDGVCSHCHDYERRVAAEVFPPPLGSEMLAATVAQIKRQGRRRAYDCILGLSG